MHALRLALLTLLVACFTSANADGERTMRYAFEVSETGFDPAQLTDLYSRNLVANIFDAPMRYAYLAPPGTIEPNVLSGWPEVSADFRTFTFHLRPGIFFTDDPVFAGKKRELVAADFVFSFKRMYDPRWKSAIYGQLSPLNIKGAEQLRATSLKTGHFDYDKEIADVTVLDRYTWRIQMGTPSPRFVYSMANTAVFGALAREVVEEYGDAIMEHPVGTGPFMLKEWTRSSKLILARNPNYRTDIFHIDPPPGDSERAAIAKAYNGKPMPFLDSVEVDIVEESQPRWLAFLNGEQDYMERVPPDLAPLAMPNNELAPNLKRKNLHVERAFNIDETFLLFNLEDPVFGGYTPERVALRRAIGLAFNVPQLISSIYKYEAVPSQTIVMPYLYSYDPQMRTEMGEYNPDRANALLDIYGYKRNPSDGFRQRPDGSPLIFTYSTTPDQRARSTDEIVKKSMDTIGIRTVFNVAKWPEQLKAARSGRYTAWMLGNSATAPDPADSFRLAYGPAKGGDNLSRFELPEYDELFRQQDAMPDGPERIELIRSMQRLLTVYEPMKMGVHRIGIYLAYPWLKNIHYQPFVRDWWRYVDIDPAQRQTAMR